MKKSTRKKKQKKNVQINQKTNHATTNISQLPILQCYGKKVNMIWVFELKQDTTTFINNMNLFTNTITNTSHITTVEIV